MQTISDAGFFKPTFNTRDSKLDAINQTARGIIADEAAVWLTTTERLKTARLARDAALALLPQLAPVAKPIRRKKAASAS